MLVFSSWARCYYSGHYLSQISLNWTEGRVLPLLLKVEVKAPTSLLRLCRASSFKRAIFENLRRCQLVDFALFRSGWIGTSAHI